MPSPLWRVQRPLSLLRCAVVSLTFLRRCDADFVYSDFNQTAGLVFNGDATTVGCAFGQVHDEGTASVAMLPEQLSETAAGQSERTVEASVGATSAGIAEREASFGHRDDFAEPQSTPCSVRARMTPSRPHRVGSMWHHTALSVHRGFLTRFSFQVTDPSRTCVLHRDPAFSTKHHRSCAVHGGDGLAFVVHGSAARTGAIGEKGAGVGYEGIEKSLAVEFDTWFNPQGAPGQKAPQSSDVVYDHVSVHSAGAARNSASASTILGSPRPHKVGEGAVHLVQVAYLPYLADEYASAFTTSRQSLVYAKDNGESGRLGTLVVWMDEGVRTDSPLLAIPINLSALLSLDRGAAFAGFTSSTGDAWQKHDVLDWRWCDSDRCAWADGPGKGDSDSHQGSPPGADG